MDTGALRQKILDLAIRGKLVPQDPNDEPASILLDRIRAEKQQMVKDGKLKAKDIKNDTVIFKAEDNLHYEKFADGTVKCIEDEIPFDVPEGWEWERLGNISTIARGGSPRPIKAFITTKSNGINWIKIGDTEKNGKYIFSTREKIKPEGMSKSRYVRSGDFLLTNSMSFGRPYILKTDGCIHDGWLVIENVENVFNQYYLYYALSADFMYKILAVLAGGSTVDNLNSDLVKSVFFPIPPMNEQVSIAKKIEQILSYTELLYQKKSEIVNTIIQCKSKILDLAIRGKLVPQDPNDEPASVLLERIRTEKDELIKQGKIKRDKNESFIFKGEDNSYYEKFYDGTQNCINEEIPFEVPSSWIWCRLGTICTNVMYGLSNSAKSTGTHKLLRITDIQNGSVDWAGVPFTTVTDKNDYLLKNNDIVFTRTGATVGKSFLIKDVPINAVYASYLIRIRLNEILSPEYIYRFFNSECYWNQITDKSVGVGQPNCNGTSLKKLLIPIPPFSEQPKIVMNANLCFSQLSEIEQPNI